MTFLTNCVFIDESAFHINLKGGYGQSRKGAVAVDARSCYWNQGHGQFRKQYSRVWCCANNLEKQQILSNKKRRALVKVRIKTQKDKKGAQERM